MAGNSAETVIAANGSVWIAAVGTSFPATPTTSPSGSWTDLGLITEAGLKVKATQEIASFMAWQTQYPIRTIVTNRTLSVGMMLRQWNETNLVLAMGGGAITGSGPYTFTPPTITGTPFQRAVLIRGQDGSKNYDIRIKRMMPVDLGELAFLRTAMTDLAVNLMMQDDGDDSTAPWDLLTDDTNFA